MTLKKSDEAISPVIGVMLMLAVTIIIAAVVVAVSTGMVTETEPAPNAVFDVEIYSSYNDIVPSMHITHVSGDPIDTADLKFVFTWDCPHSTCPSNVGNLHSSTYEFVGDGIWGNYDDASGCDRIPFDVESTKWPSGYFGSTIEPLYINHGLGAGIEYEDGNKYDGAFFGYFTLERGTTIYAYEQHLPKGDGNPAMDVLLNNGEILTGLPESVEGSELACPSCQSTNLENYGEAGYFCLDCYWMGVCPSCGASGWPAPFDLATGYCSSCEEQVIEYDTPVSDSTRMTPGIMACLPEGTPVDVTILHIPSNKPIFDKTVYVQ